MCVEQFIGLSEIELKDSIKMPGDLCIMIFHDAYTFHSGFYNYNMISDNQDILYVTYDIINDISYLGNTYHTRYILMMRTNPMIC